MIPETVLLRATTRSFSPRVRDQIEPAIHRIANVSAAPAGRKCGCDMSGAIRRDMPPSMAAEDSAGCLEKKPAAYIWIASSVRSRLRLSATTSSVRDVGE